MTVENGGGVQLMWGAAPPTEQPSWRGESVAAAACELVGAPIRIYMLYMRIYICTYFLYMKDLYTFDKLELAMILINEHTGTVIHETPYFYSH